LHDPSEHNLEGLIWSQYNEDLVYLEDSQLDGRCIKNEEISETNKEYSFYAKHFMGKVIKKLKL
jgi:hypothetical protein